MIKRFWAICCFGLLLCLVIGQVFQPSYTIQNYKFDNIFKNFWLADFLQKYISFDKRRSFIDEM